MLCFTVREDVRRGIDPILENGKYEYPLPIEEKFARDLERYWDDVAKHNKKLEEEGAPFQLVARTLWRVGLHMDSKGAPTIKRCPPPKYYQGRQEEDALVLLETHAGEGGKVHLTSTSYDEIWKGSRVKWQHREFPPMGVLPVCSEAELQTLKKEGVEHLSMVLLLNPGAAFRIVRTGQLEGASGVMFIHFNGSRLWKTAPIRQDRGGVRGETVTT